MLKLTADFKGLDEINRKLKSLAAKVGPGSPQVAETAARIEAAILEGHQRMMREGVDRHGRQLAPLAASTLKNRRRASGGPLMPGGNRSSFYSGFTIKKQTSGGAIQFTVTWSRPYAIYHFQGQPKGSKPSQPNWSLPQRDVNGIDQKTRDDIRSILAESVRNALSR